MVSSAKRQWHLEGRLVVLEEKCATFLEIMHGFVGEWQKPDNNVCWMD